MNPIDRDFPEHLERIREFLRIPSVSANDGDLRSTADAVCDLIRLAGGEAAPREPGERRPTVIGVIDAPPPVAPDGVTVYVKGTYPPARAPLDAPPVRALAEALERHDSAPRVRAQAPWWAPYHVFGVPFAAGGPGSAAGAHGPDEWCEIEALRRLMHVAHDALFSLAFRRSAWDT